MDQEKAAELVALALDTLPGPSQVQQQAAIDAAVDAAAAHHPNFLRELTVAVLKAAAAKPPPHTAQRLLAWSAALLAALPLPAGKKAAAKLIEAQGGLLETIAGAADADGNPAARQAAAHRLQRMLRRAPALAAEFEEVAAAAAAAAPAAGAGVVGALLDASTGGGAGPAEPEAAAAARELGLKLLCDGVIAGKDRPAPAALACLAPLLARVTPAEWAAHATPALARALRRTPEAAMAATALALKHARALDLGDEAAAAGTGEVVALMLQQLRTKEAVRPAALEALAAIARRVGRPEALQALAAGVRGVLDGSAEGKIKAASERVALVHALTALAPPGASSALPPAAAAAAREVAGPAADDAAAFCASFIKDEPTEEVKVALTACLAAWLPACAAPPPAAGAALAALLADAKEPLRRAALRALGALSASSPATVRAFAADLAAPLAKLVKEGTAKAAARGDGLAALQVAAAAGGAAATSGLDAAGPRGADTPLLAASTLSKLPAAEAAPAGPLAASLLLDHTARLAAAGPAATAAAARLLALALLHHGKEVRSAATAAAAPVAVAAGADGQLAAALMDALRHWENDPEGAGVLSADGGAEDGRAEGTHSWRFAQALAALAPRGAPGAGEERQPVGQLGAGALAALLLAAHHPAITRGVQDKRRALKAVLRHAPALNEQVKQGPVVSEVVSTLFGPSGLASPAAGDRAAASHALGSCLAAAPYDAHEAILPLLQKLLDRADHDALTRHDVDVWRTPEGVLLSEVVPEGVYVGEVVASKNVRKARGRMRVSKND
jgi:hypothetical protein